MVSQVHYEVFARRRNGALNLEQTLQDRDRALATAQQMLASGEFVAVKVVRETLDPETGEFKAAVLMNEGEAEKPKAKMASGPAAPLCASPAELYAPSGRAIIGRLLETWLEQKGLVAFELLHRPDMAAALEAAGGELQHAVQKFAVPHAVARGRNVHEIIRSLHPVIDKAMERLRADARSGRFPDVRPETIGDVCRSLAETEDGRYLLGGGVCAYIAAHPKGQERLNAVLDLADAAPAEGAASDLAFDVLVALVTEMITSGAGLTALVGAEMDSASRLAMAIRLIGGEALDILAKVDAAAATLIPPLSPTARHLSIWLTSPRFAALRVDLGRGVLQEIGAPRRLRPDDPAGEVEMARVLAMALTAAVGPELPAEAVQEALTTRSQLLVGADFVGAYASRGRKPLEEALDLARLVETVIGGANRRLALRWLEATLTSSRLDAELSTKDAAGLQRLAQLARLYRQIHRNARREAGADAILQRISSVGDRLEAEGKLIAQVLRSRAQPLQKLGALMKMASGEASPPGPAAQRAKDEAKRLLRHPDIKDELSKVPGGTEQLRAMVGALDAA